VKEQDALLRKALPQALRRAQVLASELHKVQAQVLVHGKAFVADTAHGKAFAADTAYGKAFDTPDGT
jgi:hypothetical protein